MTTPTPGIHYNVPAQEYHSWKACSHSWLKKLRQSPAHLRDLIDNGGDPSTPDMLIGSAVHCAVLEEAQYELRYAVREEGVGGATKAGKDFKRESEEMGLEVLSVQDGRLVGAVARRAKAHPRVQEWLCREHKTEVSFVWERDKYLCKARADLVVPGLNVLADLKTTLTASAAGFATQVARLSYHAQAAWYLDGAQRLTGQAWDWWFVACEKRRPFLVNCQALPRGSEAHLRAVAENDKLFEAYKSCCQSGRWPGYEDVDEIVLPAWATEVAETEEETSFDT